MTSTRPRSTSRASWSTPPSTRATSRSTGPRFFGNDRPVELEVGSGKGLFLATAATERPGHNFLGIELARKYARLAAERAAKRGLTNVRVWPGDARSFAGPTGPRGQPAGRPRLLPRPLVEEAAQEAPGVQRGAGRRDRRGASSRAASCTWRPTSRSTSVSSAS